MSTNRMSAVQAASALYPPTDNCLETQDRAEKPIPRSQEGVEYRGEK
jgi:hypothetical protein